MASADNQGFTDLIRRAQGGDRQAMDSALGILWPHLENLRREQGATHPGEIGTSDVLMEVGLRA